MKILVADDDTISRSMMQRMLLGSGYEVIAARDGLEAIERISEKDGPRLVLLDWVMPGLDGPEVCRAVRSATRSAYVYITLLTSKESKDDLVAGLEAGADDYVTKPCHPEELKARLRTGQRVLRLEDMLVTAREEMRFKATHDALTLLLDRGAMLQEISAKLEEARRLAKPFAAILCDVDHFKRINDMHGHPVGDEVLREIARRLKQSVREYDTVGRYGGEEFLLMLNACDQSCVTTCAERICENIRSTAIETTAGPIRVSLSAGAVVINEQLADRGLDGLLREVDRALYEAKRKGRDRVVLASSKIAAFARAV